MSQGYGAAYAHTHTRTYTHIIATIIVTITIISMYDTAQQQAVPRTMCGVLACSLLRQQASALSRLALTLGINSAALIFGQALSGKKQPETLDQIQLKGCTLRPKD